MAVPLTSTKRGALHNFVGAVERNEAAIFHQAIESQVNEQPEDRSLRQRLQALLQRRVIGVQLFQFRQQDLHILQLTGFLPIVDQ